MLADIHGHGWHIVAVPTDDHGPGFAFTVGLYLRTLQPEVLIMGVAPAPSGRALNAIGDYVMAGTARLSPRNGIAILLMDAR